MFETDKKETNTNMDYTFPKSVFQGVPSTRLILGVPAVANTEGSPLKDGGIYFKTWYEKNNYVPSKNKCTF